MNTQKLFNPQKMGQQVIFHFLKRWKFFLKTFHTFFQWKIA
jgi:hypothetical protein